MSTTSPIFNITKRATTSGFGNNCGLNCIVHFLYSELETKTDGELQEIYGSPGNKDLLSAFFDYYKLDKVGLKRETFDIVQLKKILQQYQHPKDREIILGPILRKCLGNRLKEHYEKAGAEDGVMFFKVDAIKYLKAKEKASKEKEEADKSNIMSKAFEDMNHSYMISGQNALLLDAVFEEFQRANLKEGAKPLSLDEFLDANPNNLKEIWLKNGRKNYLDAMSSGTAMVSADELALISKTLGIGVTTFGPISSEQLASSKAPALLQKREVFGDRQLNIINIDKNHWEYEASDLSPAELQKRNGQYSASSLPQSERIPRKIKEGVHPQDSAIATDLRSYVKLVFSQVQPSPSKPPVIFRTYSNDTEWSLKQSLGYFRKNIDAISVTGNTQQNKITQSFKALTEFTQAVKDPSHLFHGVELDKNSTEKNITLHVTSEGVKDTIRQKFDEQGQMSAQLSGNAQDRSYIVFALANKIHTPPALELKPLKDRNKILKTMEAFLRAEVPLDIGEHNKKLFTDPELSSTLSDDQRKLYEILSNKEKYTEELTGLDDNAKETRKLGEPFKPKAPGLGLTGKPG